MFFDKRIKKIEIPEELLLHLKNLEKYNKKTVRYSLSLSNEQIEEAKKAINNTRTSPTFNELLFKYIDRTNLTDSQVYKKAHIDRRLFSKIRNEMNYHPSKETIICLALSLQLNISELKELLDSAYYSIPNNTYFNIAIIYCFENKIYEIDKVNEILYACNLPILKGKY